MNSSRILLGVAQAHHILNSYVQHMDETNRLCLDRLTAWKNIRTDDFTESILPKGLFTFDFR